MAMMMDFLELFTAVHKTGRSAAKKATLLPILCPAIGVTGSNWIIHASKAFEQIGLKFDGVIQGPLLRPPSHEGPYLCGRSVNATEVGRLLRGLIGLEIAVADSGSQHVSAHSLKATGLAWSARFGLSWPDRAILGRHQSHTNETVAIYSRDLAVGPVTKFAEMIKSIYLGVFCPDAERSQYFPFPPNHLQSPRTRRHKMLNWLSLTLRRWCKTFANRSRAWCWLDRSRWSTSSLKAIQPRVRAVNLASRRRKVLMASR